MKLQQPLPGGSLDIVGDVHGELDALRSLLKVAGYDARGRHPEDRTLIFIGDLVDRGPDSPGVVRLVRQLVDDGRALAILGNHELNLLRGQRKDGNDWFWGEGTARDAKYHPCAQVSVGERDELLAFLGSLPLALARADLRVVHAAWQGEALDMLHAAPPTAVAHHYNHFEACADEAVRAEGLDHRADAEELAWAHAMEDIKADVPLLPAIGRRDELLQMANPVRVLTSGVERLAREPFYSSGKWRFAERVRWWDEYDDTVPVVVGHYWRRMLALDRARLGKGDPDLFADVHPLTWHGSRGQVFCVDFSVGGRYRERQDGQPGAVTRLAALRWPERTLVLDTGESVPTQGFGAEAGASGEGFPAQNRIGTAHA